ncbi:MAG: MFS transporter [Proteobacteria bacterium]|nr:MFS transporter [Pseudomonadota bacterium]
MRRAPARFVAIYALAYASLWLALLTPAIITLALRVRQLAPGNAAEPISRVLMAGAIVALISNPVFGALSDSTRTRFGRRRPWLVGGVLCGCAALAVIGLAPTVDVVLFGWCAAQLAFNAVLAAMVAIVPDRIPAAQRGTVVGILGICMPVGQIAGTFLVQQLAINMTLSLVVPGMIGVAGVLVLALALGREPPAQPDPAPAATAFESGPRSHRDFAWAWLSRVFFTTGSCFLQAYQPFFLLDALHQDPADVPRLMFRSTLVQAAMVVIWSLISGRLSDRTGRRKPFVMAGSTLQGFGLWIIAASNSYAMLLFGVGLVGMGHGVYEGVDLALVTDVLPDRARHAAKDLGLLNIANTLPQVIAPLAAPAILAVSHGDYMLLFAVAGAVAVLGSIFLLPLKKSASS